MKNYEILNRFLKYYDIDCYRFSEENGEIKFETAGFLFEDSTISMKCSDVLLFRCLYQHRCSTIRMLFGLLKERCLFALFNPKSKYVGKEALINKIISFHDFMMNISCIEELKLKAQLII